MRRRSRPGSQDTALNPMAGIIGARPGWREMFAAPAPYAVVLAAAGFGNRQVCAGASFVLGCARLGAHV